MSFAPLASLTPLMSRFSIEIIAEPSYSFVYDDADKCGKCGQTSFCKLHQYFPHIKMYASCTQPTLQQSQASTRYRRTMSKIVHSLCEQHTVLNNEMKEDVENDCCRLAELCHIIAEGVADPTLAKSLFAKVATMSRDQLLETYGLFDPNFGTSMFAHEKILWTGLMSRVLALDEMIKRAALLESNDESIVQHEQLKQLENLKQLQQQCYMLACVIEFHLMVWMIKTNADSKNSTHALSIDGDCACGSCNGTAMSHAYDALPLAWSSDMAAVKACEDVQSFIAQSFTVQPRANQSDPL